MRLLLVEDDPQLAKSLKAFLAQNGFVADCAADGEEGEAMGDSLQYDAVILDLGLPRRPGLQVLENWRRKKNLTPVLILTARGAWNEKVEGFKAGADDYLVKPFHPEELLARITAVTRRVAQGSGARLQGRGFTLDEERQAIAFDGGESVPLTGVEFRLLRYFMLNEGTVLSKATLEERIYDDDASQESNVIEVYVRRLREKLGDKDLIKTRRGQGYVFGE
ncbi:MAG: response regulator transcription factor [Candidatus Nitrosotenuis sp.]|nr:MAG: response regulator transcription factor [Candidatus Nitrosotenuis sp.]